MGDRHSVSILARMFDVRPTLFMNGRAWTVKDNDDESDLVNANGECIARMSQARARGIAAALNTQVGREAYQQARHDYGAGN